MTIANEPAFPEIRKIKLGLHDPAGVGEVFASGGLTKREYFAAMALPGILANPWFMEQQVKAMEAGVAPAGSPAELALAAADNLLALLEKSK